MYADVCNGDDPYCACEGGAISGIACGPMVSPSYITNQRILARPVGLVDKGKRNTVARLVMAAMAAVLCCGGTVQCHHI